jgi:C-terminal processing protease CtpA/Prc
LLAEPDSEVTLTVERADETLDITVTAADLDVFNAFGMFGRRGEFRPFPDGEMPFRFDFAPGSVRLGVMFETIDATVAADNDLSVTEGALITDVLVDSAAAEAGLQVGDVVTAVNGDVVDAERTLRDRLVAYEAGDTITLDVLRADETLSVDVTLAAVEMNADNLPFFGLDELPFEFGEGGFPRFFFGPDGNVRPEPAQPVPNV